MPVNGIVFQHQLVIHGACTLAHMKTGSLFRVYKSQIPNLEECMCYFNDQCSPFGYHICILEENSQSFLVYVYNAHKLSYILSEPSIIKFLSDYGYEVFDIEHALIHLQERLCEPTFPHEIGVFLGYPLQDVKAFITPNKECLLIGYWKVYGNVKNCRKTFHRFDCCKKTMEHKILKGEPLVNILKKVN